MKLRTIARIIRHSYLRGSIRGTYWSAAAFAGELAALRRPENSAFRREIVRDQWRFLTSSVTPIDGETSQRARRAAQWLLLAQKTGPDDGVSLGYFPCQAGAHRWRASYPETTGYIISTLLAYASRYGQEEAAAAALRMAEWEVAVQMPSGAVQGGPVCDRARQSAAAFNTGMVLDGWCSAYVYSGKHEFAEAARRAADFLVGDLDEGGYFRTNGAFVSPGELKTYTCLCAWAIYRFGEISGEPHYKAAAVAAIEAALRQQQANGWFAHNCLSHSDSPLTHTLGYTLQGVLEVGSLSQRPDFIGRVRRAADAALAHASSSGYLPGRFYPDWEPAGFSSCLTGSAQMAIVAYRLFELTGVQTYRAQGDKLVNYLKALQRVESPDPAIVGAISGSFPLLGSYMRAGYPNWATKYFLDALLLQDRLHA